MLGFWSSRAHSWLLTRQLYPGFFLFDRDVVVSDQELRTPSLLHQLGPL